MATANSLTNLITMTAKNDTARVGQKLRVCGVVIVGTSLTAAGHAKLTDGAGTLDIIPQVRAKSGTGYMVSADFTHPVEVVGLKAVSCTNANIRVHLQ